MFNMSSTSKPKEANKIKLIAEKPQKIKKLKPKNDKEIDMVKFKKKIADEMANAIASKIEVDPQSQYSMRYREYISEDFTCACIVFVNRLISESATLPPILKNENNIHKHLLRIIKELMMDEYEITILSLYLDEYGWTTEQFSIEDHLLFVALLVKVIIVDKSMKNIDLFIKYYEQIDKGIIESYKKWSALKKEPKTYCNNEIDLRFRRLKKPFNTYCKTNYIDYNSVVDKILRMSLPYNENNKPKEDNFDHTIDDSIPNTSHINLPENIIAKQPIINPAEYSYKPTDLLLNSNRYNTDYGQNKTLNSNMNNNTNRLMKPMQGSNPKIFAPKQVIAQEHPPNENLKATSANSNPYLQGLNFYNSSMKFDGNIAPDYNNQINYYWAQNLMDNPMRQPSNPHLDLTRNRNENESLQNLQNKSNNNLLRSAFSLKEFFNPDLDSCRSSLMSKNFEQLANERLKGPEARSTNSLGQLKYEDNMKGFAMNYGQNNGFYYNDYSRKDNNFSQPGINKALIINTLFNNPTTVNIPSQLSDQTIRSSSNESNADKKNLLNVFVNLQEQQTKNK